MEHFEYQLNSLVSDLRKAETPIEQSLLLNDLMKAGQEAIRQVKLLNISEKLKADTASSITDQLTQAASSLLNF
ncbi:hypothetical protein D3C80_1946250 [compost metagenome]